MKKIISLFTGFALLISLTTSAYALSINSFSVYGSNGTTSFDPADKGENDDLILTYSLNSTADYVTIEIRDSLNNLLRTFSAGTTEKSSGVWVWDGEVNGKLIEPGMYTATLTAKKIGESEIISKKIFYATYNDSNKPEISNFELSTDSYNPYSGNNVTISFTNEEDSDITVEVRNNEGKTVATFGSYDGDNYDAGEDHSISWNGRGEFLTDLKAGNYDVYVVARNGYGVTSEKETININYSDSGTGSGSASNSHIEDFTVSPFKFEPNGDKELKIKFDIAEDLDELKVIAVHGSTQIEIFEEDDVQEQDNFEVTWDGEDNDEEVKSGDWKIQVKTKVNSTTLTASRSFQINFEKADIDDFILSKSKFDHEAGEFTNILFRVDDDTEIDLVVLEDNKVEDEIVEDFEVEDGKWYSVEWDGEDFDYDDDLDIKLIVENGNSEKLSVDLAEDSVSSKKTNVTNDYIEPAIGASGDDMTLHYELDDEAEVTVTIYKGSTASGSKVIELVDDDEQDEGEHSIEWDGRDDDDDKLSKGVYSYKVLAENGAYEEFETGIFVIGSVGDTPTNKKKSTKKSGKISSNVISIDGKSGFSATAGDCGNFADVSNNSKYCEAVEWAYNEGIFVGYGDGTFKPFQSISRSEALKVILEALDIEIDSSSYSPFKDVAKNSWYSDYIFTAKNLGIFHGDNVTGKARPEATVNRAELLKFIFESLEVSSDFEIGSCSSSYSDVSKSNWYFKYACEAEGYDLFDGNYLSAGTLSSRGETAYLLYKLSKEGLL